MADSVPVRLPGGKHDEIAVRIAPTQRFAAKLVAWEAVQQADVSQKEERIEGRPQCAAQRLSPGADTRASSRPVSSPEGSDCTATRRDVGSCPNRARSSAREVRDEESKSCTAAQVVEHVEMSILRLSQLSRGLCTLPACHPGLTLAFLHIPDSARSPRPPGGTLGACRLTSLATSMLYSRQPGMTGCLGRSECSTVSSSLLPTASAT